MPAENRAGPRIEPASPTPPCTFESQHCVHARTQGPRPRRQVSGGGRRCPTGKQPPGLHAAAAPAAPAATDRPPQSLQWLRAIPAAALPSGWRRSRPANKREGHHMCEPTWSKRSTPPPMPGIGDDGIPGRRGTRRARLPGPGDDGGPAGALHAQAALTDAVIKLCSILAEQPAEARPAEDVAGAKAELAEASAAAAPDRRPGRAASADAADGSAGGRARRRPEAPQRGDPARRPPPRPSPGR